MNPALMYTRLIQVKTSVRFPSEIFTAIASEKFTRVGDINSQRSQLEKEEERFPPWFRSVDALVESSKTFCRLSVEYETTLIQSYKLKVSVTFCIRIENVVVFVPIACCIYHVTKNLNRSIFDI